MNGTLRKVFGVLALCVLLAGAYVVFAPATVQAKPGGPPGPPLPCDQCPGTIKKPPCICHLYDCTPDECVYVCDCW